MNCEYCGKSMPESYHYEVGGVVDCGCRESSGGMSKLNGYLDDMFSALTEDNVFIDYDDCVMIRNTIRQHIAELEAKLETARINRKLLERKYDALETTRLPDELLETLIHTAEVMDKWESSISKEEIKEAEAILAKRKERGE